ncbi:MAG: ion transporter [Rhodobiaceae bacterium]|nr:ion transporter [Rhodobiaceae bacterium]
MSHQSPVAGCETGPGATPDAKAPAHAFGTADRGQTLTIRRRIFEILEVAKKRDRLSRVCDSVLIVLIAVNVVAVILETVNSIHQAHARFFEFLDFFSVGIFSIEYGLRVWSCVDSDDHALRGGTDLKYRIRYMMTPMAVIDLVAILPFYLSFMIGFDLRFLRILRLLRVLKLTRYSPALKMLLLVFREESGTLFAAFFVLAVLLVLSASGIYIFEHRSQPEAFGSIPASMWWAMATLTTVGYGDVTPITVGGKIFGGMITIVGIGTAALPAGILASGFVDQIRRRREAIAREFDRALADGHIDSDEERTIEHLRRQLGISSELASNVRAERLEALSGQLATRLAPHVPGRHCPHCGALIDHAERQKAVGRH